MDVGRQPEDTDRPPAKAPVVDRLRVGVSAWRSLPDSMVEKAFKKCCISNCLDGTEDDALWEAASDKLSSSDDGSASSDE